MAIKKYKYLPIEVEVFQLLQTSESIKELIDFVGVELGDDPKFAALKFENYCNKCVHWRGAYFNNGDDKAEGVFIPFGSYACKVGEIIYPMSEKLMKTAMEEIG